jgi:hypothetical protein
MILQSMLQKHILRSRILERNGNIPFNFFFQIIFIIKLITGKLFK